MSSDAVINTPEFELTESPSENSKPKAEKPGGLSPVKKKPADADQTVFSIPLSAISIDCNNLRIATEKENLEEFVSSIDAFGLLNPILVERIGTAKQEQYRVIAGNRRLLAHQLLGRSEINARLYNKASNKDVSNICLRLTENAARNELCDFEHYLALKQVVGTTGNNIELAKQIGYSKTRFYRMLAFAKLPDFVVEDLYRSPRALTGRTADEINGLANTYTKEVVFDYLKVFWPQVMAGSLPQSKLPGAIKKAIENTQPSPSERETLKLFRGNYEVGTASRCQNSLTLKLNTEHIPGYGLREFAQHIQMLLDEINDPEF